VLEPIKAKNGEKNCPARKNRTREDSDDFIKEIIPLQTPRRSSKRRQNQPIPNLIPFSVKETSYSPLPRILQSLLLPVREDLVSAGMGKANTIG
jgi:hypothetical protein